MQCRWELTPPLHAIINNTVRRITAGYSCVRKRLTFVFADKTVALFGIVGKTMPVLTGDNVGSGVSVEGLELGALKPSSSSCSVGGTLVDGN